MKTKSGFTPKDIGTFVIYTAPNGDTYSARILDVQCRRAGGYVRVGYHAGSPTPTTATVMRADWSRVVRFPLNALFAVV